MARLKANFEDPGHAESVVKSPRERIIEIHSDRNLSCDKDMVEHYLNLFEPRKDYERPRKEFNKSTGREFTRDPYADRIEYLTKSFLGQDGDFQRYIMAAREDGIFWRGDDRPTFQRICDEHLRMQGMGVAAYRTEAFRKMRELFGRMG